MWMKDRSLHTNVYYIILINMIIIELILHILMNLFIYFSMNNLIIALPERKLLNLTKF